MRLIPVFFLFLLTAAYAQTPQVGTTQKIGYADTDIIISKMPEFKQVQTELQTHGTQLDSQLKSKMSEYETKLKAYREGAATMLDAVRADKERELTALQESIQKFQQDAQSAYEKKHADLMTPIYQKVGKAISEVAKENGYSFIINSRVSSGDDILLHVDPAYDISDLVLQKMGVPATNKP